MSLEELEKEVQEWAGGKGLIYEGNEIPQANKFAEEAGEFVDEVIAGNRDKVIMEGGDVLVTLCVQAKLQGTSLTEMLGLALAKIQKRKGKLVDGVFVKEGD